MKIFLISIAIIFCFCTQPRYTIWADGEHQLQIEKDKINITGKIHKVIKHGEIYEIIYIYK